MRFAIVGAGGVGGFLAVRLAADGNEVIIVERGEHRDAIASRGLVLVGDSGTFELSPAVVHESPHSTGLCDFVLLCVRIADTEAALDEIRPLVAHDSAVICLQDGVSGWRRLRESLGDNFVVGAFIRMMGEIEAPGCIRQSGPDPQLVFGEIDGASTWRVECLSSACASAGIHARVSCEIETEIWDNVVLQTAITGSTARFRCTLGEVIATPSARAHFAALAAEAAAVAEALGNGRGDDALERAHAEAECLPPETKSPLLLDLEAGRAPEVEALLGAVNRLGRGAGVSTPVTEAMYAEIRKVNTGV